MVIETSQIQIQIFENPIPEVVWKENELSILSKILKQLSFTSKYKLQKHSGPVVDS